MANITPGNWINALKGAVESRATEGNEHQYIAVLEGREYRVINASEVSKINAKLSIQKIVIISGAKFHELENAFKRGEINEEAYLSQAKQILHYTQELIRGKEDKGWLRFIARIFTSFLRGLGISSVKLDHFVNKATEETSLRADFNALKPQTLRDLEERQAKIEEGLKQLSSVLAKVKKEKPDAVRQEALQTQFNEDIQVEDRQSPGVVKQFAKDMRRGYGVLREDGDRINDHANLDANGKPIPQPAQAVGNDGEARVAAGAEALQALFVSERDRRWESALQVAVNQATIASVYSEMITEFNGGDQPSVEWEENGRSYSLKLAPDEVEITNAAGEKEKVEKLPPIKLTVIRDDTGDITRVDFAVEGSLGLSNGRRVIQPEAVKCTLEYSMTLDDQNRPVIRGLKSTMEPLRRT